MEETASRTLVVILVATLFIALFGSVATLNKFGGFKALTGAWSDNSTTTYGAVNLTISQNLLINFTDDTANFGTGYVCAGCSGATIGTDQTNTTECNCGWRLPTGLLLKNTGNRHAAVKISNINNSNSLLGGTLSGYAWKWNVTEAGLVNATCQGGNFTSTGVYANSTFSNITTAFSSAVNWTLCDRFNYSDVSDTINISFKFHIDISALARSGLSDIWTVSAVDQGQ